MENHLGYPKNGSSPEKGRNSRNGYSLKTVKTTMGDVPIQIPRDRESTFEPQMEETSERCFFHWRKGLGYVRPGYESTGYCIYYRRYLRLFYLPRANFSHYRLYHGRSLWMAEPAAASILSISLRRLHLFFHVSNWLAVRNQLLIDDRIGQLIENMMG